MYLMEGGPNGQAVNEAYAPAKYFRLARPSRHFPTPQHPAAPRAPPEVHVRVHDHHVHVEVCQEAACAPQGPPDRARLEPRRAYECAGPSARAREEGRRTRYPASYFVLTISWTL